MEHDQLNANNISFSLKRRQENCKKFGEIGIGNEILFSLPEDGPSYYYKKFSNDGRFLYAFGGEGRFLIYPITYKGKFGDDHDEELKRPKFTDFFNSNAIEIDVIADLRSVEGGREIVSSLLCRDFCLNVTEPGSDRDAFVILAASCQADCFAVSDKPPKSYLVRSDGCQVILNDSHTAFPCLDHVTFFLISLKTMKVVDFIHFKYDFIYLAHHLGVSLKESEFDEEIKVLFSILSMKNQRIFLFKIDFENFSFKPIEQIARNSNEENDQKHLFKIPDEAQFDESWGRQGISGFMMKLIKHLGDENGIQNTPLPYSILKHLHLWKHQWLSNGKLLLRLVHASIILSTNPRHQSTVHALDPLPSINQNSFLVLMDWKRGTGAVEKVWNSADKGLIKWMRGNWNSLGFKGNFDEFDSLMLSIDQNFNSESFFDCNDLNDCNDFSFDALSNATIRRFTNTLPQSPQQFTHSPLMDTKIFRWDPKVTTILAKIQPISCNFFNNTDQIGNTTGLYTSNYGPTPIKFFSRSQSNFLSHSLNLNFTRGANESENNLQGMEKHKWINVLFHPKLPLVLVYQYGIFRSLSLKILYN